MEGLFFNEQIIVNSYIATQYSTLPATQILCEMTTILTVPAPSKKADAGGISR